MNRRDMISIPPAAILPVWSRGSSAAQETGPPSPPVRRVDHIMIRTDQPARLSAFLREVLQLPVAWPLATRGQVTSGGVGFGNVNVEAVQFPGQPPADAYLVGFGFEPIPLSECLRELARRGIRHGVPRPFVSTAQGGSPRTLFTNVTLQEVSDADRPTNATVHIFLSEYDPGYVDVEQRRARLRQELDQNGGGPLGVRGVEEIIIGTKDWQKASVMWQRLVEPIRQLAPGLWRVGDGPSIRVIPAGHDRLQTLVVRVHSLPRAKEFLRGQDMLGRVADSEATIDPSKLWGLDIRLIENR